MPVYEKGDKWRVVVWHGGVRHDWVIEGTKAEAKQWEAAKRVEYRALDPGTAGQNAPRLSVFCAGAYKTHAKRHLKQRTFSNREYTLANLMASFGDKKLTDIHTADVERYKAERTEDGIRPATVNDELKVLRAVLAYAVSLGVPVSSPTIKNLPVRGVRRRAKAWTAGEVDRLLDSVWELSPELEPLVVFLLNTGCRKGEALALEWSSVDTRRRLVRIEPSEEWQPKDGEAREIPISDALLPFLERPGKRWVFTSERGTRFAYWPQRAFDRARTAAGLRGGPHTCRHTFATHFLQRKPDLFLLAKLLGHSQAYVTELYAHLLPDHLATARNVVSLGGVPRVKPRKKKRKIA